MGACASSGSDDIIENSVAEVLTPEQIALADKKARKKNVTAFHLEEGNAKASTKDSEEEAVDELADKDIIPIPGFIIKVLRKGKIKVFLNVCFSNQVRQMFINKPRLTLDKNGNDSVAYDCILTEAMFNQTFSSGSDHVMHTLCVAVIKKVNECYDDALAVEYTRVKKAKKFIGDETHLMATVPHYVFMVPGSIFESNEHIQPMTRSGMMKKHGHTNSDAKDRFFFLCR